MNDEGGKNEPRREEISYSARREEMFLGNEEEKNKNSPVSLKFIAWS